MKNIVKSLSILILAGLCLSFVCCDKSAETISKDIIFSECKEDRLKSNDDAGIVETTYKDRWLYITHKDIYLNCAFEEIKVATFVNGSTIELNIEENPANAKCMCPVDISYSVGEFEKGTYMLIIKRGGKQIHSQTVEF